MKPLPPKAAAAPPAAKSQSSQSMTPTALGQSSLKVRFGSITKPKGQRVGIYGTGGVGKTTLACMLEGKTAFVDLDESLPILKSQLEEQGIELPVPVDGISTWRDLRATLKSSGWDGIDNIIIDTATRAEELCVADTIANVPTEKGKKANRLEDYGFGKGYQHVYDTFLGLLGDLDFHVRAGRNVILIAHECTATVPNPRGEDYLRYEPRLQDAKGKGSIRHRVKEWADHLIFVGYDVEVLETGVAAGSGTRTIYTSEQPFCMAKSRTCSETIDYELGSNPWTKIIK